MKFTKFNLYLSNFWELDNENSEWEWEFSQHNWELRSRMRQEFSSRVSISRSRWESRRSLQDKGVAGRIKRKQYRSWRGVIHLPSWHINDFFVRTTSKEKKWDSGQTCSRLIRLWLCFFRLRWSCRWFCWIGRVGSGPLRLTRRTIGFGHRVRLKDVWRFWWDAVTEVWWRLQFGKVGSDHVQPGLGFLLKVACRRHWFSAEG